MNYKLLFYLLFVTFTLCPSIPSRLFASELGEEDDLSLFYGEDELVETSSHAPKPISQIAENVTIITAEQIEAMGVHTIADVVNRVAGVTQYSRGLDFALQNSFHIHGSDYEHILVMVDGIRWNKIASGIFWTNSIPLQIVKRVEVIKGAASSSWGSALGGVVNIITKGTGSTLKPRGTVSSSIGEHGSTESGLDLNGRVGDFSYFVFAGYQFSHGIKDDRYYNDKPVYGKFQYDLPGNRSLAFSIGYLDPEYMELHYLPWDNRESAHDTNVFYNLVFDTPICNNANLNLEAYKLKNNLRIHSYNISNGVSLNAWSADYNQEVTGAKARLSMDYGNHAVVLGAEIDRGEEVDYKFISGYRSAPIFEENWSLYVNDTFTMGNVVVTPGVRYDHSSINNHILSPSLGATYRLKDNFLLRGQVARGYRRPVVSYKKGDPVFYGTVDNTLEPEIIWTYQAGIEAGFTGLGSVKTTLFWHASDDTWGSGTGQWTNGGRYTRKGIEIEARSVPFYDFTIGSSYTFTHQLPQTDGVQTNVATARQYNAKFSLDYDDNESFTAQLFGSYVWYGALDSTVSQNGKYSAILCDLSVQKAITFSDYQFELFGSVHNLFKGSQYSNQLFMNAPRWSEAGVRFRF